MPSIIEQLEQLAELHAARDVMKMVQQDEIDKVLTPEIKSALEVIEAEFAPKISAADEKIAALESEIRQAVIQGGKTVKGTYYMAVWNKGRAGGWDTAKLDGMAELIPQIKTARKPDGEPTCTLRKVG